MTHPQRALLALLLGLATTLAVACILARTLHPPFVIGPEVSSAIASDSRSVRQTSGRGWAWYRVMLDELVPAGFSWSQLKPGPRGDTPLEHLAPSWGRPLPEDTSVRADRFATGWPFPALWGGRDRLGVPCGLSGGASHVTALWLPSNGPIDGRLPCHPIWWPLAADSLLYAGAWWPLLLAGTSMHRLLRHHRLSHGLCPTCRYDLTGNTTSVCPECGKSAVKFGGIP
jgi:hypothetical protein